MRLWQVYHEDIPAFLWDFASTDAMVRLKNIGMNCGVEYTQFPLFKKIGPHSRYDHSVGVALIVWHFTRDKKQTIAGLLHDISTPVFAHVVDFMNHDHMQQESTEEKTKELILNSAAIMKQLKKHRLTVEDVCDYHRYPVADNDSPRLSADRLEYSLSNGVNFGFRTQGETEAYYKDLTVVLSEEGECEIAFQLPEPACGFAEAALMNAKVYVSDADRFSMQYLADILSRALDRGVLLEQDLFTTEPEVIEKLIRAPETAFLWEKFRGYSVIHRTYENPKDPSWLCVPAKKRYVDPLVRGLGRVTEISERIGNEINRFLSNEFDYWISAL